LIKRTTNLAKWRGGGQSIKPIILMLKLHGIFKRHSSPNHLMGKIIVLGLGSMGRAAAYYLANYTNNQVKGFDASIKAVQEASALGLNAAQADVLSNIKQLISDGDAVISALPQSIADEVVNEVHAAGVPVIDMIYMWKYDESKARSLSSGSIVIPACGWAPGLTNLLAAAAVNELDEAKELGIHVGGNPINPAPPLYYSLLFSLESTIDEYVRPATIIRDGNPALVNPLDTIKPFETSLMKGEFEEFYTDGLSTLVKTLNVKNMYELTIRWKGHLQAMKLLRDIGILSDKELAAKVLSSALNRGSQDFSITVVEARGFINGEDAMVRYEGIDYASGQFTSMARLTGFFAAEVAKLLLEGYIRGSGLTPVETIYSGDLLELILSDLRRVGIKFWRVERQLAE